MESFDFTALSNDSTGKTIWTMYIPDEEGNISEDINNEVQLKMEQDKIRHQEEQEQIQKEIEENNKNNKSYQFVTNRIESGILKAEVNKDERVDSTKLYVFSFWDVVKLCGSFTEEAYTKYKKNGFIHLRIKTDLGMRSCKIIYEPNGEFDFCTTESSKHDGTMIFTLNTISKALLRVLTSNTWNTATAPKDYETNLFAYDLEYIVGDFVVHTQYGNMNINGNHWPGQLEVVCLPISVKYIKREVV